MVAPPGKRLRVAPHPAIGFVVAIYQHADSLAGVARSNRHGGTVEPGNLAGCSRPEEAVIPFANVAKELLVVSCRILIKGRLAPERHVIGVRGQQRHTAMRGYPIEFFLPDIDVPLAKHHEKVEILHQAVRKLDIAGPVWTRDPEGEDGPDSIRLGLEGIRVKRGAIVLHAELVQPRQLVLHQRRAKSAGIPLPEILIDPRRFPCEFGLGVIEFSIVVQTVYSDFESAPPQHAPQGFRDAVFPFRDEVERRSKTIVQFQVYQPLNPAKSSAALDIVGQDDREALALRPARPSRRSGAGFLVDGPHTGISLPPGLGHSSPHGQTKSQGKYRLGGVIGLIEDHCWKNRGELFGRLFLTWAASA